MSHTCHAIETTIAADVALYEEWAVMIEEEALADGV